MKQVSLKQQFDFDLESVVAAREARYHRSDLWPEISDVRLEHDHPDLRVRTIAVTVQDSQLTKFFKAGQVSLLERIYFNRKHKSCRIDTQLNSHQKLMHFVDSALYTQVEAEGMYQTHVSIDLSVHVKIPLLCALVEKVICKEFEAAASRDQGLMHQHIEEQKMALVQV